MSSAPFDPPDRLDAIEDAFHRAPRCAVHAEREARRAPCARCGGYACELCFDSPAERHCASCRERLGPPLAWEADEDGNALSRFWATVVQTVPAPFTTFEGVRDGRGPLSALWFATLANLVSYGVPMILCAPCVLGVFALMPLERELPRAAMLGFAVGTLVGVPLFMAVFSVGWGLAVGLIHHLGARIAGGTGSLVSSLRAALFLNVLAPLSAASSILGRIPLIGIAILLAAIVGTMVWQTFALAGHARGAHGIRDGRVWLIGALPAILTIALFVGLFILLLSFALLGSTDLLEDID